MKQFILFLILFLIPFGVFAAPLESGYSQAPVASASSQERANAFLEARYKVIDAAEKYLNIPYRHGGLNRNGLDCSGLIFLSFSDALGVSPPRSTTALYSWVERIPRDRAQPGDLVFFKTDNSAAVTHVGLYMGGGLFIHSASSGSQTGVIYSNLNESYWAGAFVAAGRAFPEAPLNSLRSVSPEYIPERSITASSMNNPSMTDTQPEKGDSIKNKWISVSDEWLFLGVAIAPSLNLFLDEGPFFRGFSSQIRVGAAINVFSTRLIFGFEIRPEYDAALEIFRLPFTLSLGFDDKYTIFAGPVVCVGDASLTKIKRDYTDGTTWIGTAGITVAPFIWKNKIGELAPYIEGAWQYHFPVNTNEENVKADILAGSRFSTGLRWTMPVR